MVLILSAFKKLTIDAGKNKTSLQSYSMFCSKFFFYIDLTVYYIDVGHSLH
jgi:hypothetical protein